MQSETCALNATNGGEVLELAVSGEVRKPRRARGKAKRSAPSCWLRTVDAARYLGLSASLMRKYRAMGRDDPGVHGPAFIKVSHNVVLYEVSALEDWLDARKLAALERNARS